MCWRITHEIFRAGPCYIGRYSLFWFYVSRKHDLLHGCQSYIIAFNTGTLGFIVSCFWGEEGLELTDTIYHMYINPWRGLVLIAVNYYSCTWALNVGLLLMYACWLLFCVLFFLVFFCFGFSYVFDLLSVVLEFSFSVFFCWFFFFVFFFFFHFLWWYFFVFVLFCFFVCCLFVCVLGFFCFCWEYLFLCFCCVGFTASYKYSIILRLFNMTQCVLWWCHDLTRLCWCFIYQIELRSFNNGMQWITSAPDFRPSYSNANVFSDHTQK